MLLSADPHMSARYLATPAELLLRDDSRSQLRLPAEGQVSSEGRRHRRPRGLPLMLSQQAPQRPGVE